MVIGIRMGLNIQKYFMQKFLKYILDKNKYNVIFDDMIVCRLRSNNKIFHKI